MKKQFLFLLLLGLLCSVGNVWGDETDELTYSICSSSGSSPNIVFSFTGSDFTINTGSVSKAQGGSGTGYNLSGYMKFTKDKSYTIVVPDGVEVSSVAFVGAANDNGASTITIGEENLSIDGRKTYYPDYHTYTHNYATPTSSNILFSVSGKDACVNIKISYRISSNPSISASDASIAATESGVEVTKDIAVTGSNLTGSTLTAVLSPAVDGLSVSLGSNTITDGSISTTATLHYTQTANASGSTNLTLSDGTTSKSVTITYSASVEEWTLQTVSSAAIWDFSTKVSGSKSYTGEDQGIEHVYANISELSFSDGFDATTIAFTGEYPFRGNSNKYAQNGTLRIHVAYPGNIIVKFSDTGTKASDSATKRYLVVNDETTEYWTSREKTGDGAYSARLNVTTDAISVPAGDVTIKGTNAIIVTYLSYTPIFPITINGTYGWASMYLDFPAKVPAGATAYYASAVTNSAVTLSPISAGQVIPANTGVVVSGAAGNYDFAYSAEEPVSVGTNYFKGCLVATAVEASTKYVLSAESTPGSCVFGLYTGTTLGAYKAYMDATDRPAGAPDRIQFIIEGENNATNIENIESAGKAVKFIENGRILILRDDITYDALGRIVK